MSGEYCDGCGRFIPIDADHYCDGRTYDGTPLPLTNAPRSISEPRIPQPWENAAAYEAWLLCRWPDNEMARAIYNSEANTRAAFVAGAEWERARLTKGTR